MTVPALATIPTHGRSGGISRPPASTFVLDTGVGTAGVDVTSRTGEKGATWALVTGFTGALVETDVNRFRKSGTTSAAYIASGTPATADYDCEADFVIKTLIAGDATAITGRQDPAANTCLRAQYSVSAVVWQLTQFVAGSSTALGTYGDTPFGTRRVKLQFRGTTVNFLIDNVVRITATTAVTAAGQLGLRNAGSVAQANNTGIHIANVVGTNV